MQKYEDIEGVKLPNGKTIGEVNNRVHGEVEKIYLDSWAKGVAVPYFDEEGNIFLANADGAGDTPKRRRDSRHYRPFLQMVWRALLQGFRSLGMIGLYPTAPSRETESSLRASTANSMGSLSSTFLA